jgi:hypothetical protein
LVLSATCITAAEKTIRGVCVDGDMDRAFVVSEPIPQKALVGGHLPQIECGEDGITPKAITWIAAPEARPVLTIIGRFKGHEIIDLTFPVAEKPENSGGEPFQAKVLAFRTDTAASSPMLPFFVITSEPVRWYEQVFTFDQTNGFLLELSRTTPGNGVMWSNFTFAFEEGGALIKEISQGGRKQQTTVMKFRKDGSIESTEKFDEN